MIDIDKIKSNMSAEDSKKIDLALMKLKTLTPESRSQILEAMELMIECDKLRLDSNKEVHSKSHDKNVVEFDFTKDELEKLISSKYDELKTLAKLPSNHNIEDNMLMAVAKVLNLGTYMEGAWAIDSLIKINLLKMMECPRKYFMKDMKED